MSEQVLIAPDASRRLAASSPAGQRMIAGRLEQLACQNQQPAVLEGISGSAVGWPEIAALAAVWQETFAADRLVGLVAASPLLFARNWLAALAAGIPIAPIDPRAGAGELERVVEILGVVDMVVEPDGQAAAQLGGIGLRLWAASEAKLRRVDGPTASDGRQVPFGVAEVLATSGTTGAPKLVPLRALQMLHVANSIVRHHRLTAIDRGYSPLPLFHINAQIVGLLSALVAGSSLVVEDRFHRSSVWEVALEREATWLNFVPAILTVLSGGDAPPAALTERVRFVRSASAALATPVLQRFESLTGMGILETYGLTEAASQVTANPLQARARRQGSAGRPVGVALRVTDEGGAPITPGTLGIVEIAGPGVIDAYLGRGGEAAPAVDAGGWFRTGDLGRLDDDGFVYLAGRRDDIVNRGGELIEPREVEDVLRAETNVADVAVVGRAHAILGQEPVAFVRPAGPLAAGEERALITALERRAEAGLSRFKRPVEYRLVGEFPLGRTGKVSRRALAASLEEEIAPS